MHLDDALYRDAGSYYDSTLTFMEPNTLMRRRTQKKRDNLEDVIKYENIAQVNDSIIGLTKMSEEERLTYFTQYTDKLDRKSTRLNSSHVAISYAVFCLKKKKKKDIRLAPIKQ